MARAISIATRRLIQTVLTFACAAMLFSFMRSMYRWPMMHQRRVSGFRPRPISSMRTIISGFTAQSSPPLRNAAPTLPMARIIAVRIRPRMHRLVILSQHPLKRLLPPMMDLPVMMVLLKRLLPRKNHHRMPMPRMKKPQPRPASLFPISPIIPPQNAGYRVPSAHR